MSQEQSPKCLIGPVRFSYANVFEARAMEGSVDKKFSVSLLIPKKDKALVAKINAALEAAWEAGKHKFNGKKPAKFRSPLRDGDEEKQDDENYAGHYFINASSKESQKPGVLGPDKKPITNQSDFYSGCFGYAAVSFFCYDTAGNKGIGAGLNNLLKTKDGEPLGGRVSAEVEFADLEVLVDEDDML